jgi:hypothetical protein
MSPLLHVAHPRNRIIIMIDIFCDCPNLFGFFEYHLTLLWKRLSWWVNIIFMSRRLEPCAETLIQGCFGQFLRGRSAQICTNSESAPKENEKNALRCRNGENTRKFKLRWLCNKVFTLIGPPRLLTDFNKRRYDVKYCWSVCLGETKPDHLKTSL